MAPPRDHPRKFDTDVWGVVSEPDSPPDAINFYPTDDALADDDPDFDPYEEAPDVVR